MGEGVVWEWLQPISQSTAYTILNEQIKKINSGMKNEKKIYKSNKRINYS